MSARKFSNSNHRSHTLIPRPAYRSYLQLLGLKHRPSIAVQLRYVGVSEIPMPAFIRGAQPLCSKSRPARRAPKLRGGGDGNSSPRRPPSHEAQHAETSNSRQERPGEYAS